MRRLVAALAVAVVLALTLAAGLARAAEKAWQPPPAMQHAFQECLELVAPTPRGTNSTHSSLSVPVVNGAFARADPSLFQFEKCLSREELRVD